MANREVLTFRLGQEYYAVDILKVQEIRNVDRVTEIADTPDFIRGVIDLRGIIVPIVDMRLKFRLALASYDAFTVVIILNVIDRIIGIVVDGVADVITLNEEQVRQAPDLEAKLSSKYIDGLARLDERLVILLDMERLMSSPEMHLVSSKIEELPVA